jgi:hypothetical protein
MYQSQNDRTTDPLKTEVSARFEEEILVRQVSQTNFP